jgi:hypothetical protein
MKVLKLYPTIAKANKGFRGMIKDLESVIGEVEVNYANTRLYVAGIDYNFVGATSTYKIRNMRIDKVVVNEAEQIPKEVIQIANDRMQVTRGRL